MINNTLGWIVLAAALPAVAQPAWSAEQNTRTCKKFSELHVTLERNDTDGDTEVVFFGKGQDEGMRAYSITAPDGRKIVKFEGSPEGIGMREFVIESAEPPDLGQVLKSFPEGIYKFRGTTMSGGCLKGEAALSHAIAPAPVLLTPTDGQTVPVNQVVLSWQPVPEAVQYVVELNNEDTGTEAVFHVLPPATSIAVPRRFLIPGNEYQFVVGVKTETGNVTYAEVTFKTELPGQSAAR
jgi:hypothetical protein